MTDTFESIVRELAHEDPHYTCADEGTFCLFCGKQPKQTVLSYKEVHDEDCLIVRARKLVEDKDA